MINYFYDPETNLFQLDRGDVLLIELPQADPMTPQQAEQLAAELAAELAT